VKFLSSESVQLAYTLGAIALIWLLAAVVLPLPRETLATQAEKLLSERVILGFAMAAAVIATAAVSFTGVVNQSLAQGFVALALLWLIGASFSVPSIGSLQAARTTRDRYAVQGDVVYIDSARRSRSCLCRRSTGFRDGPMRSSWTGSTTSRSSSDGPSPPRAAVLSHPPGRGVLHPARGGVRQAPAVRHHSVRRDIVRDRIQRGPEEARPPEARGDAYGNHEG